MTKQEFQKFYGFTDEEMDLLTLLLKLFNGKIVSVDNKIN